MIAKITTGAGFRGALDYLMKEKSGRGAGGSEGEGTGPRKLPATAPGEAAPGFARGERHRLIGGNMSGQTPRELAAEFGAIRRQRPSISKPVHHVSLSAAEGERLTVEQWQAVAQKYVTEMGFGDAPYVVVQHRDTELDHVHVLTSRVDVHGRVVKDSYEKRRAEEVMREVEREFGLTEVASSREVDRAAPKRGETEEFNRTGKLSAKMSLQGKVERALKSKPTVTEFIERLGKGGVEVIPYVQSTGRVSGISFRQGDELMKGSDLGRGFSWGGLRKRGLDYDPIRDRAAIEAAWDRANPDRVGEMLQEPGMKRRATETILNVGNSVGQFLIDGANPIKRIERQVRQVERIGEALAEGYRAARELLKPSGIEGMQRAAGIEGYRDEREVAERLNKAIGGTPAPGASDGLKESPPAGVARADLETTPAVAPAVVEVEVEETVSAIEFLL
jgi:hypothetical protein